MRSIVAPILYTVLTICVLAPVGRAATPPNIVIVLADDMGMGDTSVYQDWSGNPAAQQLHTPALERLARMGVRCTDAHAPHSRCTTSRYALLTGRYCWRTSLKHWVLFGVQCDPLIDRPRITLPEFLQAAGYRTGMVGKWHLGLKYRNADGVIAQGWDDADLLQPLADCPLDHGFDFFFGISRSHGTSGPNGQRRNAPDQAIGPGWLRGRQVIGATGNGKLLDGSYRYDEIGETLDREAFAFLASAVPSRQPFFLYFASPANHTPYTPSKQVGELPVAGASRFVDGTLRIGKEITVRCSLSLGGRGQGEGEENATVISLPILTGSRRLDFIYQNDVHVARLLDYLERTEDPRRPGRRLLENTLFLFSSDNGAEVPDKLATGPLRSHKASLYEGGHRVPFVAAWPLGGIGDGDPTTPGATCADLLGLNDLYATFAEILQVPLPPPTGPSRGAEDSFSRLAVLRGDKSPERPPLFPNDHQEASRELSDQRAWVAVRSNAAPIPGQWKLLLDHRYAFHGEIHPQELYDLADDLQETDNRIDDPAAQPALDFLVQQARQAAGDDGFTRTPLASSEDH